MTPNELYMLKPEAVSKDLNHLKNCDEPVIREVWPMLDCKVEGRNERIDILFYVYDDRVIDSDWDMTDCEWIVEKLAAIKFDGQFVMSFLMKDPYGESISRFITNKVLYDEMVKYIKTLLPEDGREEHCGDYSSQGDVVELGVKVEKLEAYGWLKTRKEDDSWLEACVNDEVPF